MKSSCIILTGLLTSVSLALVQVIAVDPVKAAWSGAVDTLPPNNYVSQGITCNFDLPVYAEFFTGTATEQQYQVQLKFPGGGNPGHFPYFATVFWRSFKSLC